MVNTDADLRNVFKRLAATEEAGVPEPSTRRIELFAGPYKSRVMYCGVCNDHTYEGQIICCEFARKMMNQYFGGSPFNVASPALPE